MNVKVCGGVQRIFFAGLVLAVLSVAGCAAPKSMPPPPIIPQEPKPILVDNATHVSLTVAPEPDKAGSEKSENQSGFQKLVEHIRAVVENILAGKGS